MLINSIYIHKLALLNQFLVAKSTKLATGIVTRYLQAFEQTCADRGLTAKELCKELEVSEPAISSLKGGAIKSVKAELIVNLCRKYDYSILWMMTGQGDMKADNKARSLEEEIRHIKEILGDIIVPLLNEVLQVEIKYTPKNKSAINNLLNNISKQ